jgi:triphosphoribosyl-dephospho-CoA synthase
VYAAIRRAKPGGLGQSDTQDVAGEPDVTLLDAMRLAADRDGVAREYATDFEVTFDRGAPALARARGDGLSWSDAIVETYLSLLAAGIDTHIVRRTGLAAAEHVSMLAREALTVGGVRTDEGRQAVEAMDLAMRDARNSHNPGTTADLTAAAIFVTLLASW